MLHAIDLGLFFVISICGFLGTDINRAPLCPFAESCILWHLCSRSGPPTLACFCSTLHGTSVASHRARVWSRFFTYTVSVLQTVLHILITWRSRWRVLNKDRRPLGYVEVSKLKQLWESGQAKPVCLVVIILPNIHCGFSHDVECLIRYRATKFRSTWSSSNEQAQNHIRWSLR